MAQRNILENGINLLNTLRGPAKILYAVGTLPMPIMVHQVIDPTGGAPASGWNTLGLTRGGINVTKRLDTQIYDDVDQISGAYDQSITGRNYTISTQLAEVLDRNQIGIAFEMGTPTFVSTQAPTQVMVPADSTTNNPVERRLAVVYPKEENGKVYAFVFRRVQLAGGDKVFRFDKADPVSPALELLAFPEIATSIPTDDAWGRVFDIV